MGQDSPIILTAALANRPDSQALLFVWSFIFLQKALFQFLALSLIFFTGCAALKNERKCSLDEHSAAARTFSLLST